MGRIANPQSFRLRKSCKQGIPNLRIFSPKRMGRIANPRFFRLRKPCKQGFLKLLAAWV